jgi:putative hydrolase of the HAD superfamily
MAPGGAGYDTAGMNIVFDLGGVVVAYDRAALLAELYSDPVTHAAVNVGIDEHLDWLEMDRGTLPETDAVAAAAQRAGVPATELARFMERMAVAWTPVPQTIELLYRLHAKGHLLFCLSNMHPASTAFLERAFTFWEVFTGRVISCRVGLCKPEPAIYAHLLERYGLAASETVFIDDLDVNLRAAASFGIRTIRFENPAQCARALRALGVDA